MLDEKGWSLADLSRKSNTRPQTINSLKSGDRGIGPNLMKRLATALGVPEKALLNIDTDKEGETVIGEKWELKLLLETLSDRVKRLETEYTALWDVLNPLQKSVRDYAVHNDQQIAEINQTMLSIKGKMYEAATHQDVTLLGGDLVNG